LTALLIFIVSCIPYMFMKRFLVGFVLLDLYLFLFAILLSALLRFTDSDYRFGIFKVFLLYNMLYIMNKIVTIRNPQISLYCLCIYKIYIQLLFFRKLFRQRS